MQQGGNTIHHCYIEAICSSNVVGDPGDGRSEMTSSLSTESKRKTEGGGGGGRGEHSRGCFIILCEATAGSAYSHVVFRA